MPVNNPEADEELKAREILYLKAAEDEPDSLTAQKQLAIILGKQARWADGLNVLDRCIEIAPDNFQLYRLRANFLLKMGHSTKAVENAMTALKLAPKSIRVNLFAVHVQLADLKPIKAQELLDAILDLNPNLQQLKQMKGLQSRIIHMTQQAQYDPVKWITRRLNWRISNAAAEDD